VRGPGWRRALLLGDNTTGQIGDGTTIQRKIPTRVGTATDWKQIDTGGFGLYSPSAPDTDNLFPGHSCGIRANGALFCWGENGFGQIGDGTMTERHTPTQEVTHSVWRTLTGGTRLTCAIKPQGIMDCWGRGDLLANGSNMASATPVQSQLAGWVSVSAGGAHVMGLRSGNDSQLGTGSALRTQYRGRPVRR
jgi:alpha-tubulin suppressor-like RCC1 family protein